MRDLCGVGPVPKDRSAASKWLRGAGVTTFLKEGDGRGIETAYLSNLPEDVRRAYLLKHIEGEDLDPGSYDDAAHGAFLRACRGRRERAERKAEVARFLIALGPQVKWKDRLHLVHAKFGVKGHSQHRLIALLKQVSGVDPINFAPALLDAHKGGRVRAEIHPKAWSFFLTLIRDAAPEWPLVQAWRDVRDVAPKMGWGAVASYPTFLRRWNDLSEAQRLEARFGAAEARKRLAIPVARDKTSLKPLEWVSLDGRTKDFFVDPGDGRAVRQTFLALVDAASNFILGWELVSSENANDTRRLIKKACETYGVFDNLNPDNSKAFSSHLVNGGNGFQFRNGGKPNEGNQPPGICKILGIRVHFALPSGPDHSGGKAKIAERVFATLSRALDDRPEFKGAHAGHKPGASAKDGVKPIPRDEALRIIDREVRRYNAEKGRRSQGANGRSYEQVFREGLAERQIRKPTARQLYLAGLVYKPVAVDRFGQVRIHGWTYGGASTQNALLEFHRAKKRVMLGRDPDDFSAPAVAFDDNGDLICEGIEPIKAGPYISVQGIREADSNRKAARTAVAVGQEASDYLSRAEHASAMAMLDAPASQEFSGVKGVVAGQFKSPIKASKGTKPKGDAEAIPLEYLNNMNAAIARRNAGSGKSA